MSEWVNLIWSEVKFDAIYSESCVCSIYVLSCHIGYLSFSVLFFFVHCRVLLRCLENVHARTVNGRITLEEALHVCVFKEITEVVLEKQRRQLWRISLNFHLRIHSSSCCTSFHRCLLLFFYLLLNAFTPTDFVHFYFASRRKKKKHLTSGLWHLWPRNTPLQRYEKAAVDPFWSLTIKL